MRAKDKQNAFDVEQVVRYNIDAYVRLPFVIAATGLSRTTIYKLIQLGKFPKPIHLTERTSVWRISQVREWMEKKQTEEL